MLILIQHYNTSQNISLELNYFSRIITLVTQIYNPGMGSVYGKWHMCHYGGNVKRWEKKNIYRNVVNWLRRISDGMRHRSRKAQTDAGTGQGCTERQCELYDQMFTSQSLEEHSRNQLAHNKAAYEKPFFGRIDYRIWMNACMSPFILASMAYRRIRHIWSL